MEEIDLEIIWERHSELVETLRGDTRGDETLMTKAAFLRAAADVCPFVGGAD